jgi:hypothetical protein
MKNKWVLLLGILLVCGLAFIGCDNGSTDDGNTDPKSLTIASITDTSVLGGFNDIWVGISGSISDNENIAAVGYGTISGTSLSVALTVPKNKMTVDPSNPWKGNGDYYVAIIPVSGSSMQSTYRHVFTNGGSAPVKVAFNAALIILDFGGFKKM